MKKQRIRLLAVWMMISVLVGCGAPPNTEADDGKLRIVATVFPAYDFARSVCGDLADVTLLLPPGSESHSYEPTPKDILAVGECDLFVYVGGGSDAWVDTLLSSVDGDVETLKMMECVDLKVEDESPDGEAHDHEAAPAPGEVLEYDEHVWTSPVNAAAITRAIGERIAGLDEENADAYRAGAAEYCQQLDALDQEFRDFFAAAEKKTMVFGDRFPLRYFADEYGVTCYAAFPGCSTQTEPSAATIAFLTTKVEEENLSTVYYIEFSNHLVADSIAEATGADTALFHSCHNVSQAELDEGVTYVSLMEQNLETLRRTMGS